MTAHAKSERKEGQKAQPKDKPLTDKSATNIKGGVYSRTGLSSAKPVYKMGEGCPEYCVFGTPDQICY